MTSDVRLYDSLGEGYAVARQPDPRIAAQIADAIGDAESVLNVGAGTGNYEPLDRPVVGVEPAVTMVAQRLNRHPVVRAVAEQLPLADASFDVATAIFTLHHWTDRDAGLTELGRVSQRQVVLVYETSITSEMWLVEYFPDLAFAASEVDAPDVDTVSRCLDVSEVRVLQVPPDCTDGFTGAYWNRPERYLEPAVQAGMSTLARLEPAALAAGCERLHHAIDSGDWDHRYGWLRAKASFDMGYRLVLAHRRDRVGRR